MTTTDLYPYFIIIGSSMLIAAAWLVYQYRRQNLQYKKLIALNEMVEYDLPDFLRQCWPTLQTGGVSGLEWALEWYGTRLSGIYGRSIGYRIEESFRVQDVSLQVKIFQRQKSWEKRYFTDALAQHFFLLLRMNLWIKIGTVQGAFDQSAKMNVFLQHDMKNMLQLITLTADQLDHTPPGQEGKILEILRTAIPAVRDRAQHMLKALIRPASAREGIVVHDLATVFSNTARMYELPVAIQGSATVSVASDTLQSIVDNLLGNYSRQTREQTRKPVDLHIDIKSDSSEVTAHIKDYNGAPCLWPERLFEPFWSEHGSGRGIGLYQARQQARAAGGMLSAESPPDSPLLFILTLPATGAQVPN